MIDRFARVWLAVAASVALAWPAATEQTRLESIEVAVMTGEGSTVAGLTSDDFEVLVDGKPAPIQKLVPPPAPVTVIVLFDVTASMTNYGDIGVEIERSLVPALRPGDRARIGGIANRLVLSPAFTSVRKELIDEGRKALDFRRGDKYGPSPIWDAVQESVRALEPEPGRRGIVLVSDGRATGNTIASTEAIQSAILAGTVVHVLSEARTMYLWQGKDSYARVRPGLMLEEIARFTGGMVVPDVPKSPVPPVMAGSGELPPPGPAIARLVNDLREMYTVVVAGQGPAGSRHRVDVKVKRAGLAVRARSGYWTR